MATVTSQVRTALVRWHKRGGTSQAAALTFFSLFAIGPVLTVSLAVAADLLGDERARVDLEAFLLTFVNLEAARALVSLLDVDSGFSLRSVWTVQGLLLVVGAGAFMRQLRRSLEGGSLVDRSSKRRAFLGVLVNRAIAVGLVVAAIAGLILLSLVTALLSGALSAVDVRLEVGGMALRLADSVTTLVIAWVSFFALFRFIPKHKPQVRVAAIVAVAVAIAFVATKTLLSLYLGRVPWGTSYGAAGSLVVTLLWLFVVFNLLLIGHELVRGFSVLREPISDRLPEHT